jgi:PhzF family phenazine biosynthesis protein
MRSYRFYQVDSFTREPFTGNPAGVVPDAAGLSNESMQRIAREVNNSETAFILPPDGDDHDIRVRFFTPTTEVPSCGHATIAAHHVRAVEANLPTGSIVQKIGAGILPVEIVRLDDDYEIIMTQASIEIDPPLSGSTLEDILLALGLQPDDRDDRCPVQIVSTGHSKVMVGIRSLDTLHQLVPDPGRLTRISRDIGCNGYFVFVLRDDIEPLSHGRMFAPAIGISEDPVTGNANGPLGAYLVHHELVTPENGTVHFQGRQGEALGRPGTVGVHVDCEGATPHRVRVSGRAVIVVRGKMAIPDQISSDT